jgi:hypothetical protein
MEYTELDLLHDLTDIRKRLPGIMQSPTLTPAGRQEIFAAFDGFETAMLEFNPQFIGPHRPRE